MPVSYILEIYTPYRLFFSNPVEALLVTIADGEVCVYANHARFSAPVECCAIRIKDLKEGWKTAFISNGIIEVKRHKTVLLADSAEWPEEIDYDRVIHSKKDAEEILNSAPFHFERIAAQQKVRRADVRLKVYASAASHNAEKQPPAT
ncbi:MAG: ATP synthase F1 subunit epsilon [Spirochaetaceae bacterium]|jgi:F-type H+-transporting ATPase subunit epsilon|nr:ATP synthase F1 subunit epsilon [Spirochaetaceae bacterium]